MPRAWVKARSRVDHSTQFTFQGRHIPYTVHRIPRIQQTYTHRLHLLPSRSMGESNRTSDPVQAEPARRRRVVATMWSINDAHAPKVATDFYDYLWKNRADETGDGGFGGSLSAHALHHAIQELRARLGNSERDLLTWIPYVHFGY